MKIPEKAICGRMKLQSYFVVDIGNRNYCKIIINDIEMFVRITNKTFGRETVSKQFLEGEWIDVAVMRRTSVDTITEQQYYYSQHYDIRLEIENNSEWVSLK